MTDSTTDTDRLAEIAPLTDEQVAEFAELIDMHRQHGPALSIKGEAQLLVEVMRLRGVVAQLQERLDTAEGRLARHAALHTPVRRYTPDDGETSYDTYSDAAGASFTGNGTPVGVTFFEVCQHCADIEMAEGCEHDYRESLWPCKDAETVGLAEEVPAAPAIDAPPVMVYGASDDLIEVRGAVDDELGANYNKPSTVVVKTASGKTVWLCAEHDPDGTGEWRIYPVSGHGRVLREGHELVTIVPARGEDAGDDEDGCPGYSDKAIVKGGISVEVEGASQ